MRECLTTKRECRKSEGIIGLFYILNVAVIALLHAFIVIIHIIVTHSKKLLFVC